VRGWKGGNPEAMFDFKNHAMKISEPTSIWVTGKIKITEKEKKITFLDLIVFFNIPMY
jgi:hypothetical protein